MKSHRDKAIRCPFYRGEDPSRHVIRCEGLGDAAYTEWGFGNDEKARRTQLRVFCMSLSGCRSCEVYRMLLETKYD